MSTILIVDDQKPFCDLLAMTLERKNHRTLIATKGKEALKILHSQPVDIALLDIRLGDMSGMEILDSIRKNMQQTAVFMLTGNDEVQTIIECIRKGADEYFRKPVDQEELLLAIERTEAARRRNFELALLRDTGKIPIIGESTATRQVRDMVSKAAARDSIVLITGETGTGKELVARQIHLQSTRADEPFVPINCSAIPESLIESEFFGYERGAFTGADQRRKGKFEQAHKGTIFLDEIGDMNIHLQTRLLRFLEDRTVHLLGGGEVNVDVRVICATNQQLGDLVQTGLFRKDLFFRINVLNIEIPPLRERKSDIIPIADFFIDRFANTRKKPAIGELGRRRLHFYDWPGNVRELRNVVERELAIHKHGLIDFATLETAKPQTKKTEPDDGRFQLIVQCDESGISYKSVEKKLLEHALAYNQYNVSKTAEFLKIERSSLRSKMQRFGIVL
jgi:DNA-binding NtrC family response regulator